MIKRIKQSLRDSIGNTINLVDKTITKINNASSARRGVGKAGLKPVRSFYKMGGNG